jgi:adenylate cyclase
LSETGGRRRLAAILAADAVGFSRLMAADEDATVAALDAARNVFGARIEANQGRIIDVAGDSVLAVFETATGAVSAALAIQKELESSADATPQDRRMRFRIGIHLGDVIEKADGTIYGDGVNIAARLQAMGEPGGVTVSSMVQEAVRDHVSATFDDQGEHEVKNIARPVHVYRVDSSAHGVTAVRGGAAVLVQPTRWLRWRVLAPAALLLAVTIGAWIATADSALHVRASLATWFGKKPTHSASERASIAVLPFANQSGNPERDYFSDGITEDVINALGRFSGVMVMSRNAVQAYKARPMTSAEISRELGVRYIAQGSVREAEGRLRVVVELSDAQKGVQLWSERYEGAGADVFEIQDRIVRNIVGALAVKLTHLEQRRIFTKPTDSLEAYDLVLRARSLLELSERGSNREARALLAQAEKLAPDYAEIFTALCDAELARAAYGWIEDASQAIRRAEEQCRRALASADQHAHARAHALIATIYSHQEKFDEALSHAERAIELNPSDSTALYRRGSALLYVGRIDEAIAAMETAKRFEPHPSAGVGLNLAVGYYVAGRYREVLAQADALLTHTPHHVSLNALRAATLAQLGKADEAKRAADQVRRLSPLFDVENFGTRFANPAYAAKLQDGLRKAGL